MLLFNERVFILSEISMTRATDRMQDCLYVVLNETKAVLKSFLSCLILHNFFEIQLYTNSFILSTYAPDKIYAKKPFRKEVVAVQTEQ